MTSLISARVSRPRHFFFLSPLRGFLFAVRVLPARWVTGVPPRGRGGRGQRGESGGGPARRAAGQREREAAPKEQTTVRRCSPSYGKARQEDTFLELYTVEPSSREERKGKGGK